MSKRTLYVSDEDERVWAAAQNVAGATGSLSKMVTLALRDYLDTGARGSDEGALVNEVRRSITDRAVVRQLRDLVTQHGEEMVCWAFGRALLDEGAARSRRAVKAQAARTPEQRQEAGVKAAVAKGDSARRRAARKAQLARKMQSEGSRR